ncbi:hypothetical protein [Bradyrhizobium guangdongense]|uniref:hypothetical protein n=1 Tax=Bradyrhizobium guangdongense TaxID=1325090 RepID=UPI0013E89E71|nr:hypothetical protein [Bradyrhizobium guangdongense]
MQRIHISRITRDPIEKSLYLRYAEILALREAVRKESSNAAAKKLRRTGNKRGRVNGK